MLATLNDIQMEMQEKHFLIGRHDYGSRHRMLVLVIERALPISPTGTHLVPSQNLHTQPGKGSVCICYFLYLSQDLSMVVKSKSLSFLYFPGTWKRNAEYF